MSRRIPHVYPSQVNTRQVRVAKCDYEKIAALADENDCTFAVAIHSLLGHDMGLKPTDSQAKFEIVYPKIQKTEPEPKTVYPSVAYVPPLKKILIPKIIKGR